MAETYRHEWKHEINYADLLAIRQRLRAVASPDPHAKDGRYFIRSLYFDTPSDRALREKIDGTDRREKFGSGTMTSTRPTSVWRKKANAADWAPNTVLLSPPGRRRQS